MLFSFCHVGLSVLLTFVDVVPCISCRRKWVPETILSTIEPSPALAIRGAGQLLEARVCRTRKGVEILPHTIPFHPIPLILICVRSLNTLSTHPSIQQRHNPAVLSYDL